MDFRRLVKDYTVAVVAQGVGLLLGLVTSLVIPKFFSITDYGYWQLFLFYSTYVGFFHFGLNDGVYLINGGMSREQIDKKKINSQFWIGFLYQLIIVVGILACISSYEGDRQFILIATAIYLLISNASSYLGYLLQAINETRHYSISLIVNQVVFLVATLILLILGITDFVLYVVFYVFAKLCAFAYCVLRTKDFFASGLVSFSKAVLSSILSIRVGIKLMIAGIASMLVFGVARVAIDIVWGIDTFGQLSLAISLMNYILTFISQISMVLFPALRKASDQETNSFLISLNNAANMLFPSVYVLYFPIAWLVQVWLPQYQTACVWLAFLIPACVFDGKMNACFSTYYKVYRKEKELLIVNIGTVLVSSAGVLFNIFALDSPEGVIISPVLAIMLRSFCSELRMLSNLKGRLRKGTLIGMGMAVVFIAVNCLFESPIGFFVCIILYVLILVSEKETIEKLIQTTRRIKHDL